MPNQDGSLTNADRVTFIHALNLLIPAEDANLAAGTLGILDDVVERAKADKSSRSALMRVVEAISLDMMSHAVGGFSALTKQEQTDALLGVERALPTEFLQTLDIVRDVYYEDDRTPQRPSAFDPDSEVFGKVLAEAELEAVSEKPRRRSKRIKGTIS
jgi:hypothetical protein